MKRAAPFLVAALLTLPVSTAAQTGAASEAAQTGADSEAAQTGLAQTEAAPTGAAADEWRLEVFASPAWNGLRTAAEDGYSLTTHSTGATPGSGDWARTADGSRLSAGFGWGGGARLSRGPWGVEAAYRQIRSKDLTPSHLLLDTGAYSGLVNSITEAGGSEPVELDPAATPDRPLPRSRGDLFFGQVFRNFRLRPKAELSVGLGAGHLRVTDDRTNELLARDWGSLTLPDFFQGWFGVETGFTANRNRFVLGGSVGLTTEVGRLLIRPRLEVIVPTDSLTTAFDYELEVRDPERTQRLEGVIFTSVDPVLFLMSVEIGIRN